MNISNLRDMLFVIQPKLNTQFLELYNKLWNEMTKGGSNHFTNQDYQDEDTFKMMSIE